MKFSEIILENKVDDFKSKYVKKFSSDQLDRLSKSVPTKYLDWVGKNFETINFDENFQKLLSSLSSFDKVSSNLPLTDINSYKNLDQLLSELEKYNNKPKRDYKKVEGGNVVYDDGQYFVVNPQTHQASCYYGKGTKWCTAADSDYQFKQYNDEAKLFYILDRKKSSQDPNYKVALVKRFDGDETFFDATDKSFKNFNLIVGEDTYEKIMSAVHDYMNQEYDEQIKIFSDKLAAKKERERIERLRIQRLNAQRNEEAEERRLNNEWALGPDCPEEGLKAWALLNEIESNNPDEVRTDEENNRLTYLRNYLVELKEREEQYEEEEREMTDIYAEFEATEEEIEELEAKIDVYNMFPDGEYYDMTSFVIIDSNIDGTYAVGTEDEVQTSAYSCVEQLIDDIGYRGFNESFAMGYLDVDSIVDTARYSYDDDVRSNPEVYLDESEREMSQEQIEQIQIYKMKIQKNLQTISDLEDRMGDDEYDDQLQEAIDKLQERNEEYEFEIEDIEISPDGDFPEELIEEKVDDLLDDVRRNPESYLDEHGISWEDYVDKEEFIQGVIDADGYGHTLNRYDGSAEDYKVQETWFTVMRID